MCIRDRLGTEYFTYDQFDFEAKTQNSPTDDIPTLNAGSTRTYTSTTKTAYRILSGFGRINYNYDMRYLISFVARYDGISKLKDNRWGFFPGVDVYKRQDRYRHLLRQPHPLHI